MTRTDLRSACLVAVALALAACAPDSTDATSAPDEPASAPNASTSAPTETVGAVDDPTERAADLRILSLSGGITETLYALGAGEQIVGVDASTLYPPEAMSLPRLGYHRSLSAEGALALEPTLILGTEADGPPEVVAQIEALVDDYRRYDEPASIDDGLARIEAIGAAVGRRAEATELVGSLRDELRALEGAAVADPPVRALFLYARGPGNLYISGHGTGVDAVFAHVGLENAAGDVEDFVSFTPEAALAARPDVIVVPERGLASMGGAEGLLAMPGLSATPAGAAGRVVAVDDAALLNYGPRLPEGMRALVAGVQPEGS